MKVVGPIAESSARGSAYRFLAPMGFLLALI